MRIFHFCSCCCREKLWCITKTTATTMATSWPKNDYINSTLCRMIRRINTAHRTETSSIVKWLSNRPTTCFVLVVCWFSSYDFCWFSSDDNQMTKKHGNYVKIIEAFNISLVDVLSSLFRTHQFSIFFENVHSYCVIIMFFVRCVRVIHRCVGNRFTGRF